MATILQNIEAQERYYRRRIAELEAEVEYWKDKHWESTSQSIKHSNEMFVLVINEMLNRSPEVPKSDIKGS